MALSNNGSFNSEDAILLAAMCHQSNLLFEDNRLVLPEGFVLRYIIRALAGVEEPEEEPFGFVAESGNKIVIAFRGTDSFKDNESDQDLYQIPYPYVENAGRTHRGFTCIYRSARDRLLRVLGMLPASKRLLIAGYSLGGGLAVLSALDIASNTGFQYPSVYTFGSPRAGDPVFVSQYNRIVKDSFRIFNVHDVIPTLPARAYPPPFTKEGLYYRHVSVRYPLYFQLNSLARNHYIGCYFQSLAALNPGYALTLCENNPDFCPDTGLCAPYTGVCSEEEAPV